MSKTTGALLFALSVVVVRVSAYIPFEFQTLNYDPVEFSFNEDPDEELLTKCCTETANFNFHAYGRDFPLRLQRSCVVREEDGLETAEFTDGGTTWQGRLEDQPNSTVDGDVIDGKFEGIILTGDGEKFMVERNLQNGGNGHSLIYRVTSRKNVMKTLFPEQVIVEDEGSGEMGSGLEIS